MEMYEKPKLSTDLKLIKKHYGENMMHLCRTLFPTILEDEGSLYDKLSKHFYPTRFLYEDIVKNNKEQDFKNYIYSLFYDNEDPIDTNKTVKELLSDAGYDLYECKTESEIQSFKRFYEEKEQLCTFKGGRLDDHFVFFAVKKNVDEIKRSNFKFPNRQDDYGVSVISIQFDKGESNLLSIKNRYNHTVKDPDATFSNNLENIIQGLTRSFEREYNLNIVQNKSKSFYLPGYTMTKDEKWYKYNMEISNIYYCINNVIIENSIAKQYDFSRYLVFDYFVLDMHDKVIFTGDEDLADSFPEVMDKIKKVTVLNHEQNKEIKIELEENKITIILDDKNNMIKYIDNGTKKVPLGFLEYNQSLEDISMNNLEETESGFLLNNNSLKKISFPKLRKTNHSFMPYNIVLEEINLPSLEEYDDSLLLETLQSNNNVKYANVPKSKDLEERLLCKNKEKQKIIDKRGRRR